MLCDECKYYKAIHSGLFYCGKYKLYGSKTLTACHIDKANAITNKIDENISEDFKRIHRLKVLGY